MASKIQRGSRKPKGKKLKPGRTLEGLVASIERALGHRDDVKVTSPGFLVDRVTGELREHDVLIELRTAHRTLVIAIECRDRSRKIGINDIESFAAKCRDTRVDRGIAVSSKGFTKPALKKGVHENITCQTLSRANSFDWLGTVGIE